MDKEEGAHGMFHSLHDRLLALPPETEVWPGHLGGSLCGGPGIHNLPDDMDPERPVAAICMSGQRSAVAASQLQRLGAKRVLHVVDGGVGTWERLGYPVERD